MNLGELGEFAAAAEDGAARFAEEFRELERMGLDGDSLIRVAEAALEPGGSDIMRQICGMQRQIATAAEGITAALKANLAELDAAMERLSASMAAALKAHGLEA